MKASRACRCGNGCGACETGKLSLWNIATRTIYSVATVRNNPIKASNPLNREKMGPSKSENFPVQGPPAKRLVKAGVKPLRFATSYASKMETAAKRRQKSGRAGGRLCAIAGVIQRGGTLATVRK